jgi:hypothetical protein
LMNSEFFSWLKATCPEWCLLNPCQSLHIDQLWLNTTSWNNVLLSMNERMNHGLWAFFNFGVCFFILFRLYLSFLWSILLFLFLILMSIFLICYQWMNDGLCFHLFIVIPCFWTNLHAEFSLIYCLLFHPLSTLS